MRALAAVVQPSAAADSQKPRFCLPLNSFEASKSFARMIRFSQPIPNVSSADVERIVLRDFGPNARNEASAIIARYGAESWHQSQPRVHLAILKLAQGQLGQLQMFVRSAIEDPRDV